MTPEWRSSALCLVFHDLPWIAEPGARTPATEAAMAQVCAACPVQTTCAAYIDEHHITAGFWAGRGCEPEATEEGAVA